MKAIIRITAAAAAVAAALTITSTASAGFSVRDPIVAPPGAALTMASPSTDTYNRVITITPDTKVVNVSQGEYVKFVDTATGQSFVWDFDSDNPEIDLATVAPTGVLGGQHVMAYVQVNNVDE